jgi:hypothetical protein
MNPYFKCWAYHKSGKVVVACGSDWGWTKDQFLYWMPSTLRHTAFCSWEWRDEDRPAPPAQLQGITDQPVTP